MLIPLIIVSGTILYFGTDRLAPKVKKAGAKIVSVFKRGVKK
jgi:hypothetical protein